MPFRIFKQKGTRFSSKPDAKPLIALSRAVRGRSRIQVVVESLPTLGVATGVAASLLPSKFQDMAYTLTALGVATYAVKRLRPADPSIPPADGTCLFIRLPGELRNEIYKHALTEPRGLFYSKSQVAIYFDDYEQLLAEPNQTRPANQLQYVSRQLRQETAGLGLKHNNTLTFHRRTLWDLHDAPRPKTPVQFEHFYHTLRPSLTHWLRKIVLHNLIFPHFSASERFSDMNLPALVEICNRHPKIELELRRTTTAHPIRHPSLFMIDALLLGLALRGTTPVELGTNLVFLGSYFSHVEDWMKVNKLGYRLLKGRRDVRIYLQAGELFERDVIRERLTRLPFWGLVVPGGVDTWVKVMENWRLNGI